jgi:hypothetical protein
MDPLGVLGERNQYIFCRNSPLNSLDPSGLEPEGSGWWLGHQTTTSSKSYAYSSSTINASGSCECYGIRTTIIDTWEWTKGSEKYTKGEIVWSTDSTGKKLIGKPGRGKPTGEFEPSYWKKVATKCDKQHVPINTEAGYDVNDKRAWKECQDDCNGWIKEKNLTVQ